MRTFKKNELSVQTTFKIQTKTNSYSFSNTILDCGLDSIAINGFSGVAAYCNLGGNGIPVDVKQQGLGKRLYSSIKASTNIGTEQGYYWIKNTYDFPQVIGIIKEIGLSSGENSGYFNRQLLLDLQGNAIVIETPPEGEAIKVVTEMRLYTPQINEWIPLGQGAEIKFNHGDFWFDYPLSFYPEINEELIPGTGVITSVYINRAEEEREYTKKTPFKFKDVFEIITPVIKREYEEIKFRINWKWGRYVT